MTPEQIEIYNKAAELGTIPDEMNPIFLFSTTHTQLLLRIAAGEIDALELAKRELEGRGEQIPDRISKQPKAEKNKAQKVKRGKRL